MYIFAYFSLFYISYFLLLSLSFHFVNKGLINQNISITCIECYAWAQERLHIVGKLRICHLLLHVIDKLLVRRGLVNHKLHIFLVTLTVPPRNANCDARNSSLKMATKARHIIRSCSICALSIHGACSLHCCIAVLLIIYRLFLFLRLCLSSTGCL